MTADLLALLDAHTEAWRKVRCACRLQRATVSRTTDTALTAAEHHAQDTYNALAAAIVAASASSRGGVHPWSASSEAVMAEHGAVTAGSEAGLIRWKGTNSA